MKKLKETIQFIYSQIKKKFLINQKSEVSEKTFVFDQLINEFDEQTEEYFANYTITTRWQTL